VFDQVPLIGSRSYTLLGRPNITHAYVEAMVESISSSRKVIVFKKKRRKNYKRSFGSRVSLTQCRITRIVHELKEEVLGKAISLQ
jgi:large subunit ribosomal protein L21